MLKDLKEMQNAILSFKKNKSLLKKINKAFTKGLIDEAKKNEYIASINESLKNDLINIQGFGFALGQADESDWDDTAKTVADAMINE